MLKIHSKTGFIASSILLIAAILWLTYGTVRTDSFQLLSSFILAFIAYAYFILTKNSNNKPLTYIYLGVIIRFSLLFTLPNLSDDFYRFIWDGRLLNHGINPFLELPSYYLDNQLYSDFLTPDIYNNLNSQNYFTVYPPVLQSVFWLATALFSKSVLGSVIVMKSVLLLFEIGSMILILKLLKHFKMPEQNVVLYALNPVVILEIVGNIHFEGAMIFFSLLAVWLLIKKKWFTSALSMSIAIVAKLLPLMFLPFLIKRLGWKSIRYFAIVGLGVLALFLPLLNATFIKNISTSVGLYFNNFEYNGSFYYFFRWVGYQIEGYNMINYISPLLSLTVATSVFVVALRSKMPKFETLPLHILFALSIFYLLSTTVHPWYITSLVAFCSLTRFRYPIVWSGLIFLTYINYSAEPFHENLWLVGFEYIIVLAWVFYEVIIKRKKSIRFNFFNSQDN